MTGRDEAIEAAARAMEDRLKAYPAKTALSGTVGWGASTTELAEVALAAIDVPVLLNDLADRIEAERMGDDIDDWNVALIKAAETVRAAAEGWRAD